MQHHAIASREDWLTARKALLVREKEATRLRDSINAERLALPWVKVEKDYVFDTNDGRRTLTEMFRGRSQLIVYHFMLAPGWNAGCTGCSFVSDHLDGALPHLEHHDVALTAVSRAPLEEIEKYRSRMGWRFPWASSFGNSFNHDFHVSFTAEERDAGMIVYNYRRSEGIGTDAALELPGMSAFAKDDDGTVFHTYSSYTRGLEELIGTLMILDRAPKGRNEKSTMDFVRRHDEYDGQRNSGDCCGNS